MIKMTNDIASPIIHGIHGLASVKNKRSMLVNMARKNNISIWVPKGRSEKVSIKKPHATASHTLKSIPTRQNQKREAKAISENEIWKKNTAAKKIVVII